MSMIANSAPNTDPSQLDVKECLRDEIDILRSLVRRVALQGATPLTEQIDISLERVNSLIGKLPDGPSGTVNLSAATFEPSGQPTNGSLEKQALLKQGRLEEAVRRNGHCERIIRLLAATESVHITTLAESIGLGQSAFNSSTGPITMLVKCQFVEGTSGCYSITPLGREALERLFPPLATDLTEREITHIRARQRAMAILRELSKAGPNGERVPVARLRSAMDDIPFSQLSAAAFDLVSHRLVEAQGANESNRAYFLTARGIRNVARILSS